MDIYLSAKELYERSLDFFYEARLIKKDYKGLPGWNESDFGSKEYLEKVVFILDDLTKDKVV